MTHLLAICGSYREDGVIDRAVGVAAEAVRTAGATIEVVQLRDFPIEFCRNCRECTQLPGEAPAACVQQDRMRDLIEKIEAADGYIFASPTNFYSATALFKRFMERLIVYAYWPWDMPSPRLRKARADKKAVLIASCAAPGPLGRLFYGTLKQLKLTAKTVGARSVGSVSIGLVGQSAHPDLPERSIKAVRALAARLK